MEQEKSKSNNKELLNKIAMYKTLAMACLVLCIFAIISLVISLNTTSKVLLEVSDYLYIIVLSVMLIFNVVFVFLYKKTLKKLKKEMDNIEI